jgi:outer membrane receptor protein involved in Fe transport
VAEAIINCQTGRDVRLSQGLPDPDQKGRQVALLQCGPYAGMAGYWTHEWRETDIPDVWDGQSPIALGPAIWGLDQNGENGPFQDSYGEDSFDPQITLRYRPTDDHSLYVKWAKAFKAGGFDTSDRGISRGGLHYPTDFNSLAFEEDGQKEFSYLAEHAENFELGARGNLFDNQLRYGVTLFHMEITDLQVETEIADINQLLTTGQAPTGRYLTNAGKQRNKGIEFDFTWAATDQLTLRAAGVVQDSVMVEYFGGCTEFEALNADTGPCINAAEAREFLGLPAAGALSAIDAARVAALDGSIDRSGAKAPRAPDWKVILGADYEQPLFGNYIGMLNTKMAISDGYTEDTLGFTYTIAWPTHADWNMTVAFGDADRTWDVGLFARNILGARKKYFPEHEAESGQPGIQTDDMPQSAWFNYGIQFNYYYR